MLRSQLFLASLSLLSLAVLSFPVSAEDPPAPVEDPPVCEAIKSSCPPKSFAIVEMPNASKPQPISSGEAFVLYHECQPRPGGLACTGWPQEHGSKSFLRYQWSFEGHHGKLVHNEGTLAEQSVECASGEQVTAVLTIINGKYRVTSSETYVCGKR